MLVERLPLHAGSTHLPTGPPGAIGVPSTMLQLPEYPLVEQDVAPVPVLRAKHHSHRLRLKSIESFRISRPWLEYITDFVKATPLWDYLDGDSSGKESSKLAPRQNPRSSPEDLAPSFHSGGPSGINQAEDAFTYRELHQLVLELAENGERSRPPGRVLSGMYGTEGRVEAWLALPWVVQRAHLLRSDRQKKESDQIAAQITDIQGQLKEIREQNSARDSFLKQVWDHVKKLNQWAA
ncbi:hypothetical protein BBP40_010494, partial [Aspergillus hancockii]